MKINSNNYYQYANQVGIDNLSPGLKKMHEVIDKVTHNGNDWNLYATYKDRFDKQFEALEMFMDEKSSSKPETKVEPKETPVIKKETQPYKVHKPKETRPYKKPEPVKSGGNGGGGNRNKKLKKEKRFEKPKVKGKGVELISPEVTFIRRFALLHNKTKNKEQVVAFIKGLQKAMIEKRIRKTSKHSKVIQEIQKQLVNTYKRMAREITFKFAEKDLYRYYKMAGSEVMMPSVRFIKAYYNMQGKEITIQKVNILLLRIKKALDNKIVSSEDKYYKHVKIIKNSLEEFLNKRGKEALSISEAQLNGLEGILKSCGCRELNGLEFTEKKNDTSAEKEDGVMTVDEARKAKFRPVELTGEWLKLIGKMCLPTHFLVYGLGGSGKTSFVLLFTQYLASLGYRILYVAREQYNTPTFTELLNRLNISVGDNFKIVKDLLTLNAKDFDFVVLDSKDDMDIQIKSFVDLKEQYPQQSFIMISQGTKKGDFTGTGRWRNVVDVMVFAENGVIKTGLDKNRWGGAGEFRVIP